MSDFPAIRAVLASYRSTAAHITEAQVQAAWAEYDALAVRCAARVVPERGQDEREAMVEAAIRSLQAYRKRAGEAGWPEGSLIIESFPAAIDEALNAALAALGTARVVPENPAGDTERLRQGLIEATDHLREAINGYKIERSAQWMVDNGFTRDEPPIGSLHALAAAARSHVGAGSAQEEERP